MTGDSVLPKSQQMTKDPLDIKTKETPEKPKTKTVQSQIRLMLPQNRLSSVIFCLTLNQELCYSKT